MTTPNQLVVYWIDHRGKEWNLTTGAQGVRLSTGQSDFGISPISHAVTATGDPISVIRQPLQPSLVVEVGIKPSGDLMYGQAYYDVADEWWGWAASAERLGTLRVIRPDGQMREAKFRLRDTPGTTWEHDPGMEGYERPPEPFLLIGESPWWYGAEQTLTYSRGTIERYEPIYGSTGEWPMYITPRSLVGEADFRNTGQGPMYPTWSITGPAHGVSIRYGSSFVARYTGYVGAGEYVDVTTEPGRVSLYHSTHGVIAGMDGVELPVSSRFPSVPVGESVRVSISVDPGTATPDTRIVVKAREKYSSPF